MAHQPSNPTKTWAHCTLFIWDFDNTVVLDNTDTLVFERYAPDVLEVHKEAIRAGKRPLPWTDLINNGFRKLQERGVSPDKILAAAAEAPFPEETVAALRMIAECGHARSLVLSDANSGFIEASLKKNGLREREVFQGGVFTNACVEHGDGGLMIQPFSEGRERHNCGSCAANLCKGKVLEDFLKGEYNGWRVVYVGDGGNDYCPVLRMGSENVVLARKGFPLHKKIVEEEKTRAEVRVWNTAEELRGFVQDLL